MAVYEDPDKAAQAYGPTMNYLNDVNSGNVNSAFGPADVTVGTTSPLQVRTNRLVGFSYDLPNGAGTGYGTKMPFHVGFGSSLPNLPTGMSGKYAIQNLNGGPLGTPTIVAGTQAANVADAQFPARTAGGQVLGLFTITNNSGADFDPGVTSLYTAGITFVGANAVGAYSWLPPFEPQS